MVNTGNIGANWYTKVRTGAGDGEVILEQGDLLYDCPFIHPQIDNKQSISALVAKTVDNSLELEVERDDYNVVILTQSCDLSNKKVSLVIVCLFYTLTELGEEDPQYNSKRIRKELHRGRLLGMHLLNKCVINGKEDFLVVDFKHTFSVHINVLEKLILMQKEHYRLLPPYREHLSQAFTRFFMRVGLPSDIPESELYSQRPSNN